MNEGAGGKSGGGRASIYCINTEDGRLGGSDTPCRTRQGAAKPLGVIHGYIFTADKGFG